MAQPTLTFTSSHAWRIWLAENHAASGGVWLRFYKKGSGVKSVTYAEALEEALCFGWIDGQRQKFDDESYLQKFTPRRPKSGWSKINVGHTERLIRDGRMMPAGLRAIDAAKSDGRWERAYDSPSRMAVPEDFLNALAKSKKAKAFFEKLDKTNRFSIGYRLQTAKDAATRKRRMTAIIDMLKNGERFHEVPAEAKAATAARSRKRTRSRLSVADAADVRSRGNRTKSG
jgi:uncharacterized protein YdeI (YjbR/CyaY-like superfamily)